MNRLGPRLWGGVTLAKTPTRGSAKTEGGLELEAPELRSASYQGPAETTPGGSSAGFGQYAAGLLRSFAKPVAAVLIGAATLPGFAGGALAQTPEPLEPETRIEAPLQTDEARPAQTLAPAHVALPAGPLLAEGLFEAHLAARLRDVAAQRAQFEAQAPPTPVIRRDLARFDEVVSAFDRLIREDGALPPDLLADLDHVLDALAEAKPGAYAESLDLALADLPSTTLEVPALDPLRAEGTAPTLGATPRVDLRVAGLQDLLSASPTDFPDKAQDVLQRYTAVMAGADAAVSRLPDFDIISRAPLAYDSGDGQLLVPPGARLVKRGDDFSIEAPGMLWSQDGLTVVAGEGAIRLGSDLDGLQAGQVAAAGDGWDADLHGAVIGVNRAQGYGVIRADSADLDLEQGTLHLEEAQLLVGPTGESALTAQRLRMAEDGFALDLEGLGVTQTRAGTDASIQQARYEGDGTLLTASRMDLHFGPDGARLEAQVLNVQSGRTALQLEDATATLRPLADGGHALGFTGDRIEVSDGATGLRLADGAEGELRFDREGALRAVHLESGAVELDTRDGRAQLAGAQVDLQLGPEGHLSEVALRGDRLAFEGDAFGVDVRDGRMDARFDAEGRLTRITSQATSANVVGDAGAFSLADGALDARFAEGRLQAVSGRSGQAAWRGEDGTRVDARDSRLRLGFHPDGGLAQARLASGAMSVVLPEGQQVSLQDGQGQLDFAADGALRSASASTGRLGVVDGERRLDVTGLDVAATFDAAGALESASARAARLEYQGADGTYLASGAVRLDARADGGQVRDLSLTGDELRYAGELGRIRAASGGLQVSLSESGALETLRFDTRDLTATGDFGRLDVQGAGHIDARWSEDGAHLESVVAHADQLAFVDGDRRLSVTEGDVAVTMDGDRVSSATARFEAADYHGDFGRLALTSGTEVQIRYDEAGAARLTGHAAHLDLADDAGRLTLDGGRVDASIGADGRTEFVALGAERLAYSGTGEGGHPLSVDLRGPEARLTALEAGGQRLDVRSEGGEFEVDGHRVALEGLQQLSLQTSPEGHVDAFTADFDGEIDFVQRGGDLSVVARDVGVDYQRDASRLTLDFGELDVALRGEGLQARVEGGHALLDEHQLFVRVDRAEVLREIGAQLDVEVEDLTLQVARGEQGALQALDLGIGGVDAQIDAMSVMVRTPAGERVRLHVRADEEGRTIKEAFLQIPEGGEVRVQREDLDLSLGGQRIGFTHGDDGVYRLRGEGLDIAATTKDATVRVDGGDAQVSLDPKTGELVIDEITGTRIDVRTEDAELNIDLEEVRGFMVRVAGLEGGATGAALHLVPTEDGSTLTARITADIAGVPVEVGFSDVHELEALGQILTNQVHVYARDPSGRGDIQIGVGPVRLEGSAIELVGRYHPYDPGRMTESVHQFVTTGGARLFSGVSFEPDGVLRFGTDREGLNGELAILLPRQHSLPGYRFALTDQPSAAPGVIGSVGYRSGDMTTSFFAGLMPGSHATLHVKEGDLSIGGVPVPDRTDLPTTGVAGLRLDLADVDDGHLGLVGGGFVNPTGLVDSPYVQESTPYGVLGGVEYRKDGWSLTAGGVLDLDAGGRVRGGAATVRIGISF